MRYGRRQVATTDFRILGPLEVVEGGQLVRLSGARQRALLAILLLHVGEAISSDRLMDELWGDEPPDAGSAALRVRISQLRRALGPAGELLVTRPPGYALAVAPEQVDLRRFERLVEAGDRALGRDDPAAAADSLRECPPTISPRCWPGRRATSRSWRGRSVAARSAIGP